MTHAPTQSTQATASGAVTPLEALSALADGHAPGPKAWPLAEDPESRHRWAQYHLIGELMRGGPTAARSGDPDFARAVMARIEAQGLHLPQASDVGVRPARAANDARFHWRALAGLALLALAALAVWNAGLPGRSEPAAGTLASLPASPTPSTPPGGLIRDPQLEALLAEHRQFGSVSALHAPAGFLRASVSITEP